MTIRTLLRLCLAIASLAGTAAHAQLFRTYLSSSGSDANPCTVAAPCRLLPAALAAVADGGEIWMLNSANYNTSTVTITKSVSILAIPGVVGSVVSTGGGSALVVNSGGVTVNLRNLVIVRIGAGGNGVEFVAGAVMNVRDCEFVGAQSNGILASATGGKLHVSDTVVRGSAASGIVLQSNVVGSIDRVQLAGNNKGILVSDDATATVTNSVLAGNATGGEASNAAGAFVAQLFVDRTAVTGNGTGLRANGGGTARLSVTRSVITHNTVVGVDANEEDDATTDAVVSNNVLSYNEVALRLGASATMFTRSNNTLMFNNADYSPATPFLTPLGGV